MGQGGIVCPDAGGHPPTSRQFGVAGWARGGLFAQMRVGILLPHINRSVIFLPCFSADPSGEFFVAIAFFPSLLSLDVSWTGPVTIAVPSPR
jgi:hypothetical protein